MGFLSSSVCLLFLLLVSLHNITLASVVRQCFQKHNGRTCTKAEQSSIDCIVNSINSSLDQLDIRVKLTMKISVMKSNHAKFCTEWSKIKNKVKPCEKSQICSQKTNTDDICGRQVARCNYLKYAPCGIKAGILQAQYLHELQSKLCLETDLNRVLIPYYGPHLHCYENSILKKLADFRFPLNYYLEFCKQFNYNQLKNCIESKLAPVTSDELFTNNVQFITAAKSFLQKTNQFCNNLSKIDNSFLTKCRMKNVLICIKEAFNRAERENFTSYGYYIPCISQQYSKCHAPLGTIINKTLLMDYASSAPISLNSPIFFISFALMQFARE